MNKRQAKKQENKMLSLQGMSYQEKRKEDRAYQEDLTRCAHSHKIFKEFDEMEQMLIEIGLFTPEEIIVKYGRCRTNTRWRQIRKLNRRE